MFTLKGMLYNRWRRRKKICDTRSRIATDMAGVGGARGQGHV